MGNFKEDISKVKAFVFDCDGVFTDGLITLLPSGEMLRSYNSKDGFAIALAVKRGYKIAIISGGKGEAMELRFRGLGLKDIYLGCGDKIKALDDFIEKNNLTRDEIMFMGDDIPDIEAMQSIAMPVAPVDAVSEVKDICCYVSQYAGGKGCVRDVVEQVLKVHGDWTVPISDKDIYSR